MVLVVKSGGAAALSEWQALFAQMAPALTVRGWDDETVDPASVEYVLVWEPTPGRLAKYPNLRLILSSAAGVDHILADQDLPPHLPIARMVTTETGERMADFVTMAAFALLRDLPKIVERQKEVRWDESLTGRMASETTVGIMGLGQLGTASARKLAGAGFNVLGWARSPKSVDNITCHVGAEGFDAFLEATDILVNLLPDTADTRGIIGESLLAKLPKGASVVNVGRGPQLDPKALLAALDSGHIKAAVLDVFSTEPLPADDPFWQHPAVLVTSHVASAVSRKAKALQAANAISADQAGQPIAHLYDRDRGY